MFSASMMCADWTKIKSEVDDLEEAGIDRFHLDIMDGSYVDNFALGDQDVDALNKLSSIPLDVHLMIKNTNLGIKLFSQYSKVDIIYIHYEGNEKDIFEYFDKIRSSGKKVGLAINPGTSLNQIIHLLSEINSLLIMTVHPGFSGSKYIEQMNNKITEIVDYRLSSNSHFRIVLDGAISPDVVSDASTNKVDEFVLGTSSLFKDDFNYKSLLQSLKGE